jgi:hypothetical protein
MATPERSMNVAKTQRVVFSFDERSLESLQRIKEQGRFSSMGEAVRESLQVSRALQSQVNQGFTEIVLRNPETKEERVIVIPNLQPAGR